jgi:hypothetical protein
MVFGCEESNQPKDLIPTETFTSLLAEFQIIQSVLNADSDTVMIKRMYDSVLAHYQISLNQFYESEKFYAKDGKNYQKLLNDAMDLLGEEQATHVDSKPKYNLKPVELE